MTSSIENTLSISIQTYFRLVYNETIDSSNALYLLDRIKELQQIHLACIIDYVPFRGNTHEGISIAIAETIIGLEDSHNKYRASGKIIGKITKQYDIERHNRTLNNTTFSIDSDDIANKTVDKLKDALFAKNNQSSSSQKNQRDLLREQRNMDLLNRQKK